MKLLFSITVLALALIASGVGAAETNGQQTKMATCNKEATGKKGDERKAFMKECLSSKKGSAAGQDEDLQQESNRQERR